jgi:hypothetical protein
MRILGSNLTPGWLSEMFAKSVSGSVGTCVLGDLPSGWGRYSFIDPCGFLEDGSKPGAPQQSLDTQFQAGSVWVWEAGRGRGCFLSIALAMVIQEALSNSPNLPKVKCENYKWRPPHRGEGRRHSESGAHNSNGKAKRKKRYKLNLVPY